MTNDTVDQSDDAVQVAPIAPRYGLWIDPNFVTVAELAILINVLGVQITHEVYATLPKKVQANFIELS